MSDNDTFETKEVNLQLMSKVKTSLRISQASTSFDVEIEDLILSCVEDLYISGVIHIDVSKEIKDRLIIRAIVVYCKAHFGMSNPDTEKYVEIYDKMRIHLAMTRYRNPDPIEKVDAYVLE
ncbi:hypothetical protein AOC36_09555 [Erysipelothrix larvae]|uniref:DNA-packaging protein n=1 Tax=Erysipelothrix larvae TaxID=1514105 RepID=A0A0X8H1F9_9FIRM|nr:hypothetical protein [Erysipelothrix larvae]AMC94219.1 hypothetical protein AOC36_09555 [Erysipelothrix larvae]